MCKKVPTWSSCCKLFRRKWKWFILVARQSCSKRYHETLYEYIVRLYIAILCIEFENPTSDLYLYSKGLACTCFWTYNYRVVSSIEFFSFPYLTLQQCQRELLNVIHQLANNLLECSTLNNLKFYANIRKWKKKYCCFCFCRCCFCCFLYSRRIQLLVRHLDCFLAPGC